MAIKITNENKKLIIQGIVVLVCLGFLLESFAFGNKGSGQQDQAKDFDQYSGVAELNMTVVDYRPYLYVEGALNASAKALVEGTNGVDEIIEDGDRTIISISEGRMAHDIYAKLKRQGINTYTLSTIATPSYIEITLLNGSTRGVGGTRFEYMMEPVAAIGKKVRMRMAVHVEKEKIVGIGNIVLVMEPVQVSFNATILESSGKIFSYTIPWEERELDIENLTAEFGEGNVEYKRNDYVFLQQALTPQEMIAKKYEYVEAISEMSLMAKPGFVDKERIKRDFGEVVFPNSTLKIRAEKDPRLGFVHSEKSSYVIALPERVGSYYLFLDKYKIEYTAGEEGEISVIMNASARGECITEISGVTVSD